jgi:hypothetical protein
LNDLIADGRGLEALWRAISILIFSLIGVCVCFFGMRGSVTADPLRGLQTRETKGNS